MVVVVVIELLPFCKTIMQCEFLFGDNTCFLLYTHQALKVILFCCNH